MPLIPRPLLLVDVSQEATDLISLLPSGRYLPQHVSEAGFPAALGRAAPGTLVLVEPIEPHSPDTTLRRVASAVDLMERQPTLPVIAIVRFPENNAELVASLVDAGLAEWLDLGREGSPEAVDLRLRTAVCVSAQRLLKRAVPGHVPSRTKRLLGMAVEVVAQGGQVPELAAALRIAVRTVSGWCARADLPPPRRLIAWLRLLMAADQLDAGRSTLEAIARATGYSGSGALKAALRHMVDATPRELRESGAFSTIAERFRAELRALREEGHARGRPARVWLS